MVEALVVVGIFSTATLLLANLYLTVTRSQRRVASVQRVIEDARFVFELMGQQIRLDAVNYDYYVTTSGDLHSLAPVKPHLLALRTPTNSTLFFRRSSAAADQNDGLGAAIETCQTNVGTPCDVLDDSQWQDVTPPQVKVTYLTFQIWPSADPFADATATACSVVAPDCPPSYRCDTAASRCEYSTDGKNFQPKVRVTMRSEGTELAIAERSRVNLQSLFTTRRQGGTVENDQYDVGP